MIYALLFWTFFKIGLFTFGGGHAMIPLIQSEILRLNWMTEEDIINFIGISEATPGPFAVNIATHVGNQTAGWLGGALATFGIILPSIIIILLIAIFLNKFKNNKFIQFFLTNIRPAAIGLIIIAFITISMMTFNYEIKDIINPKILISKINYLSMAIFLVIFFIDRKFKFHPIIIILATGFLGYLFL